MIETLIWDWNGTLLDDTDICIESMNYLLKQRNYPQLDKKRYREIFNFPVKDYYTIAGFDFGMESFNTVAIEFMDLYFSKLQKADVFAEAEYVLSEFRNQQIKQVLISAMEHESLINSIRDKGLFAYFDHVSGIQDHYADGKLINAKNLIKTLKPDISKTLMIGDTIHDFEVAGELGVQCLLIANGHQSIDRLKSLSCPVAANLNEVIGLVKSLN